MNKLIVSNTSNWINELNDVVQASNTLTVETKVWIGRLARSNFLKIQTHFQMAITALDETFCSFEQKAWFSFDSLRSFLY